MNDIKKAAQFHAAFSVQTGGIFMELWDAYDENFNLIPGMTLVRGEKIPEGMYHLVGEVLVRHKDGTYLLMRRDLRKHFGGLWEATAGGSALRGETAVSCALRELREETGITCETLRELGTVVSPKTNTIYKEYLCEYSGDKQAICLQEGETIAWKWVALQSLLDMGSEELVTTRMQQYIAVIEHDH